MPREPPPPYPLYQQPQHVVDQGRQRQQQQQQPVSPLQSIPLDFNTSQVSEERLCLSVCLCVCRMVSMHTRGHTVMSLNNSVCSVLLIFIHFCFSI